MNTDLNENQIHSRAMWSLIIILCIGLGILFYSQIQHENKLDNISYRYDSMYYSIVDTFEKKSFLVTATTWNPTKAQTDDSPHLTACGFKIDTINPYKQKIIGLSRDLLEHFYYGQKVKLENCGKFNGIYTVVDCGNKRLVRTVDICIARNQLGGKFKNVILTKLE